VATDTLTPPATGQVSAAARARRRRRGREIAVAYLLLGPNLLLFGVFMAVPLVLVVVLSLQRYSGFGSAEWVGTGNYTELAGDPVFWRSALNTVVFAAVTVPVTLALGLWVAVLLNKHVPGRGVFRALFYLPYVISGVVIAMVGKWIFNENVGVVNRVLRALGTDGIGWQSEGVPALVSLMVMLIWARLGLVMVIYLAGLQGIPTEYYEASTMDGAGRWQQFRYVTWPLLRPTTFFVVVLTVIESFQIFDVVYVMTGGGPGNSTQVLTTYAYETGFGARRQGYSAAIGLVVYVAVLLFTVLWWQVQKRREVDVT
jgi:ABC-type sugar transport system permease subunit